MAERRAGFTVVGLVVIFTVITVALAAALPFWTKIIQRENEAELIFRGLQYAEAIRVFQLRFGRYPVQLKELVEVRPRSIRQLWKDPMTEDGEWGLIYAQAAPTQRGGQRRGGQGRPDDGRGDPAPPQQGLQQGIAPEDLSGAGAPSGSRRPGTQRAIGPIIGVHSLSQEQGIRTFFGGQQYSQWKFTTNLLPAAAVTPGSLNVPRVTSAWVGRPFPEGLGPAQGQGPGGPPQLGQPPGQRQRPQRGRRRGG